MITVSPPATMPLPATEVLLLTRLSWTIDSPPSTNKPPPIVSLAQIGQDKPMLSSMAQQDTAQQYGTARHCSKHAPGATLHDRLGSAVAVSMILESNVPLASI